MDLLWHKSELFWPHNLWRKWELRMNISIIDLYKELWVLRSQHLDSNWLLLVQSFTSETISNKSMMLLMKWKTACIISLTSMLIRPKMVYASKLLLSDLLKLCWSSYWHLKFLLQTFLLDQFTRKMFWKPQKYLRLKINQRSKRSLRLYWPSMYVWPKKLKNTQTQKVSRYSLPRSFIICLMSLLNITRYARKRGRILEVVQLSGHVL